MPANLLGLGLWVASRLVESPLLFPGFILGTTALVHSVRVATGTSIGAARAGGWLMAEAAGEPCTKLWQAMAKTLNPRPSPLTPTLTLTLTLTLDPKP